MRIEVHQVSESREADFFRLHSSENDGGWCYCSAWSVPTWDGWGDRTADQNRKVRESLFKNGNYDGYLLYVDGEPVAWCQCRRLDRLEKLCRQYSLNAEPTTWAFTCFFVASDFRGRGLVHQLVEGAMEDLISKGVTRVQAFPVCGAGLDYGHVWTGPESVFLRSGFEVERAHERYPIYGKRLHAKN